MLYLQVAAPLTQASMEVQEPGCCAGLKQALCVPAVWCWGQRALSEAEGLKRTTLGLLGPAKLKQYPQADVAPFPTSV